ncbi:3-hydroxyacyl-CoA dehydrogenase family protein [Nonomuraea ferruginea]|uniref:3-hydroxyacyl-CoA dehydrogenase NAD-binding domain-containing protein n=1 Tax=Nonomuraea ferruginea TaxID=46174 RepID=A0ABT4T915_9ACTN|nr:3-hydroxyacyl-CoA dehydrogenase NAD-binding domain-containing protein [Nonomuraea ferruginea]MDA0645940.1 3-hydroxyacyl-CoA dehydrogenase NAD-binding domain-containing protein [Nonomuraea ferruginea]
MAFEMVGVVGLGTMGAGIAEVFARGGLRVIGVEADADALARGRGHLERSTQRAVDRGKLAAGDRDEVLGRITLTTSREDLREADLVVEAIPEVLGYKTALMNDLDGICKPETVLATNTSSLSVTAIAAATGRPGRVVGLHFFNPAPVMRLAEVVRTVVTDDDVVPAMRDLAVRLGKTAVVVGDRAGFVVNRLLLPYLNHAAVLMEQGVAGRDDIDAAMRDGAGLPMGPFQLLDLIGLDTAYEIMGVLFDETRDRRHAPAPVLRELVSARLLGRKSGRGFYGDEPRPHEPAKSSVITFDVAGQGGDELAERLGTAGFKRSAEPDVLLRMADRPVIEHAVQLSDPSRLVGVHVVGGRVAEVVSTVLTSPEAAFAAADLMKVIGLAPVACKDRAGFVVDALLYPYLNDAVRMYESGYASIDEIDSAMRLGCGYPAGPFETLESVGLDVVRDGLRALYAEYREPAFAPAPLLDQLVTAGVRTFPRP